MSVGRQRDVIESKVLDVEMGCRVAPSRRRIRHPSECDSVGEFALEEIVERVACPSLGDVHSLPRHLLMGDNVILVLGHHHFLVTLHQTLGKIGVLEEEP